VYPSIPKPEEPVLPAPVVPVLPAPAPPTATPPPPTTTPTPDIPDFLLPDFPSPSPLEDIDLPVGGAATVFRPDLRTTSSGQLTQQQQLTGSAPYQLYSPFNYSPYQGQQQLVYPPALQFYTSVISHTVGPFIAG